MANKPIIQHFTDDINKVIDKYRDSGITIGELVGAFELAKMDMVVEWHGANNDRDDDLPIGDPDIFNTRGGS